MQIAMYIYTLDSHDCYGPFSSGYDAMFWANSHEFTSYQVLTAKPYASTRVLNPF